MASRKYKHLQKSTLSSDDITENVRVNRAYTDTYGTDTLMNSPHTLDVDETEVTSRRAAFPTSETFNYFASDNYNFKKANMYLSRLTSAKQRENIRPAMQPGQVVDAGAAAPKDQYATGTSDDSHILLYLSAFVVGIIIITSIV